MNSTLASTVAPSSRPRSRTRMAMSTTTRSHFPSAAQFAPSTIPQLVNGDALEADEFLRRYEAMPDVKKAELIDGVVYIMASPVSLLKHGEPDSVMQTWAGTYSIETPGVHSATNTTTRLAPRIIPQPDGSLRYSVSRGGSSCVGADGYLVGPPELVFEVSASSSSIDVNKKLHDYLKAGVQEYIAWLTEESVLKWWYLKDGQYLLLPEDKDGILRSRVFPGLWLDSKALLKGDTKRVMSVLRKGLKSKEHAAFAKRVS
jgi:Uma2 family endonuclease